MPLLGSNPPSPAHWADGASDCTTWSAGFGNDECCFGFPPCLPSRPGLCAFEWFGPWPPRWGGREPVPPRRVCRRTLLPSGKRSPMAGCPATRRSCVFGDAACISPVARRSPERSRIVVKPLVLPGQAAAHADAASRGTLELGLAIPAVPVPVTITVGEFSGRGVEQQYIVALVRMLAEVEHVQHATGVRVR
jgi:hypothetical protein